MPSRNTYHLTWVSLTLDEGCLLTAAPGLGRGVAPPGHCPNPMELTGLTIYPSFPGGLDGKESAFNVGDQI